LNNASFNNPHRALDLISLVYSNHKLIHPIGIQRIYLKEYITMVRVKSYRKKIACLESLWDSDVEERLSVVPIVELVSNLHDLKFIYLSCNTPEELKHNLKKVKRKPGYGILYLSFHGHPGEIVVDGSKMQIESLASFMGTGFTNWVVHFGSCETIDTKKSRIYDFIEATGVSTVLGYKMDVDWLEATALDLLLLDWLQHYKDMRSMWKGFKKNYKDHISTTGLRAFHG